jgi:hypothetical protein
VVFRTRTAVYRGENTNWLVTIHSKLKGLNGSYSISIQYKGTRSIQIEDYNIYPFFQGGLDLPVKNNQYHYHCFDDCGYYDKEEELIFFIVWKEGTTFEEKTSFIILKKS